MTGYDVLEVVNYSTQPSAGIPGDGRCLFRSIAYGACLRTGKPARDEILQGHLADALRSKVCFPLCPAYNGIRRNLIFTWTDGA